MSASVEMSSANDGRAVIRFRTTIGSMCAVYVDEREYGELRNLLTRTPWERIDASMRVEVLKRRLGEAEVRLARFKAAVARRQANVEEMRAALAALEADE